MSADAKELISTESPNADWFHSELRGRASRCRKYGSLLFASGVAVVASGLLAVVLFSSGIARRDHDAAPEGHDAHKVDRAALAKKSEELGLMKWGLSVRMNEVSKEIEASRNNVQSRERALSDAEQQFASFHESTFRDDIRKQLETAAQVQRERVEQSRGTIVMLEDQLVELQKTPGISSNQDIQRRIGQVTNAMVSGRADVVRLQSDLQMAEQQIGDNTAIERRLAEKKQTLARNIDEAHKEIDEARRVLDRHLVSLGDTKSRFDEALTESADIQASIDQLTPHAGLAYALTLNATRGIGLIITLFLAHQLFSASRAQNRTALHYEARADARYSRRV